MYRAEGREHRRQCPPAFISMMRSVDESKVRFILDVLVNTFEDFGSFEYHVRVGADKLYSDDLYSFGFHIGKLARILSDKASLEYESLSVDWQTMKPLTRLLFLLLLPPLLF